MNKKKKIIGAVLILATVLMFSLKPFFQAHGFSGVALVIVCIVVFLDVLFFHEDFKRIKKEESIMLAHAESVAKNAAEILSTKMKSRRWFNFFFRAKGTYDGREAWMKCYPLGVYSVVAWVMDATIVPRRIQKPNRLFTLPKPTLNTATRGKLVQYRLKIDLDKSFTKQEIIAIFDELTKAAEIVEQGAQYFKE